MEDVPEWWREHMQADAKQVPPLRSHLDHISQLHITTLTLADLNIGDEEVKVLTACDPLCASLTSLDLAHNQIKHEGRSIAASMRGLRKLNLANNQLRMATAKALGIFPSLADLDISLHAGLTIEGIVAIARSKSITKLTMNRLWWSPGPDEMIFRTISTNTALTTLSMSQCVVRDEGAELIARNGSITHLDISSGSVGLRGARALAANTSLRYLDVSSCNIGVDGANDLLMSPNLTFLDLSMIRLPGASSTIARNTTLRCLKIASYETLGPGLVTLLRSNTNLTRLKLSQSIDMEGALALVANTTLRHLSLVRCQQDSETYSLDDETARVMALNSTLTRLSIKEVKLGREGALAFAKLPAVTHLCLSRPLYGDVLDLTLALPALANNPTLKYLDITGASWNDTHGLVALAMNATLVTLRLNCTSPSNEELAALAKNKILRRLEIEEVKFTDDDTLATLLGSSTLTSLDLTEIEPKVPALRLLGSAKHLQHLNLNLLPTFDDEYEITRRVALLTSLYSLTLSADIEYPSWQIALKLYLARNQRIANEHDALRKANMIGKVTGVFDAPTLVDLGIAAVMRHDWPLSELVARLPSELAFGLQHHDDDFLG